MFMNIKIFKCLKKLKGQALGEKIYKNRDSRGNKKNKFKKLYK